MSSYTISKKLNPKKVFILQKSELEKRFDPSWYVYLKSIEGFKQKSIPLKELLISNPQYGANEIGIERNSVSEPRYIRITDINEFGELKNELGKTASNIEEKYFLEENDLLLARSGNTVGKSYLHKNIGYNCFFAGYMIRFKINILKVNPKYIFVFTQTTYYKNWINAVQRSTGQPNINAEEYRNLKILLPNFSKQERIINIYDSFLTKKKENEEKSKNLLNSIDTYLLKELGITLPEKEENTLKSRMFTTSISELSGTRFDPYFNKAYFKNVQSAFENCSVDFSNIKSTLQYIKTGTTPHQKLNPFTENKEIVFLRNTNLKKYRIDLENTKYVKTEFNKELTYSLKGEVIMCIAGTVGLSAINDINEPISINQNVSALKFYENVINPNFASYWFNTSIFIELTKRACSVATIHYLNNDNLKLLPIPIPPLEKQLEIAEHISAIRKQAQDLKDQTKLLLEKANKEIEDILLNT